MDQLQGFFEHLVRAVVARDPDLLRRPIQLADLLALFPYGTARRDVGLTSHEDYEMAVLRLAAGERGYAQTTPAEAAKQLAVEAASLNPDTGLVRHFLEAQIQLSPAVVARVLDETRYAPSSEAGAAGPVPGPTARPLMVSFAPSQTPCPHCGETVALSWKFCPNCGTDFTGRMRRYRVAVIGGDGIGPDVVEAAIPVLDAAAACHGFTCLWDQLPYSADHYLATGETLPEPAFRKLRDHYDAVYVGALGDPRVPGNEHARDILLGLRFRLDLYINFRPVKLLHPDLTPLAGYADGGRTIDFVIFRENTEGMYLGRGRIAGDEYVAEEVNTVHGVSRIIRAAFDWAATHGKSRVTMADKSNAIPAHRVWQERFRAIAPEYPGIQTEHRYIDALAMELVRKADRYQVIVANNLFGDILSDLGAALVGGLGIAPSANLHPGRAGLFEPVHGSAPKYAGQGTANPIAAILTGGLMFEALGETDAARALEEAVRRAIRAGLRTQDLGGSHSTSNAAQAVLDALG